MTWAIVVLVLALVAGVIWIYNRLVMLRNRVNAAWSDIDVQLTRRAELIPNLVSMVRGYQAHEREVLEDVTLARAAQDASPADRAPAENRLSQHITRMFALAEDYPDLKAGENYRQLHDSLVEVESHLQYARRYYNGAVRDMNDQVQQFPSNLVAGPFGFGEAEFFEIEDVGRRQAPEVVL